MKFFFINIFMVLLMFVMQLNIIILTIIILIFNYLGDIFNFKFKNNNKIKNNGYKVNYKQSY